MTRNHLLHRNWQFELLPNSDIQNRQNTITKGLTLFYPGAGYDYGPMWYFVNNYHVRRVFHVEYTIDCMQPPQYDSSSGNIAERDISIDLLRDFDPDKSKLTPYLLLVENFPDYAISSVREIFPSYFGARRWESFWDPACIQHYRCPSYGIKITLEKNGDLIEFFFIKADAIATYDYLLATGWDIDVVVIQEHGFGCLWTGFAGKSKLYQSARSYKKMPRYLFEAVGHELWPGYVQTENAIFIKRGQMHTFLRAVCKKSSKRGPKKVQETIELVHTATQ